MRLALDVTAWWNNCPLATINQRLIEFFRTEVAARDNGPVVIFLDEIDATLKLPYTDDFFVAIRAMYNERPEEPAFKHIAFCLVGVATPNELIKNPRTTPYNIGRMIELRDFDPARDDLSPILRAVSNKPQTGAALVHRVLLWTGGHPYLTIKLCDELVKEGASTVEDVDRIVEKQYMKIDNLRSDEHFETALRFFEKWARGRSDYYSVALSPHLAGQQELDRMTPVHIQLKLTGIVNATITAVSLCGTRSTT